MSSIKLRWQERFESYQKAVQSLKTALQRFDKLSDLEQDGAVQRFEFTFELAWKTLQDYFTETGYLDAKGPRNSIKRAAENDLIQDSYTRLRMLENRDELNHTYDEAKNRQILDRVVQDYLPLLVELENKLISVADKQLPSACATPT